MMKLSHAMILSSTVAWLPSPALAQVAAPIGSAEVKAPVTTADSGIEEIVVTARRVAENLQKVPTSIGVVSPAELQSRQIASVSDLKQAVANLTVTKTPISGGNFLSIRGVVGQAIPNISVDSSIGIYLDGVYLGRPQASGGAIADIARVEVLRGPQGTLFGRNASGGAINFITTSPGDRFGVQATALYGNYDQKRATVGVDTGRIGSGFSARFSYFHEDYDGDVRNLAAGRSFRFSGGVPGFTTSSRLGGRNSDALVAKLRYDNDAGFKAEYKYDRLDQTETSIQGQLVGYGPGQVGQALALLGSLQRPGAFVLGRDRLGTLSLDFANDSTLHTDGHLLTLTKELDDNTTVKDITSYRKVRNASAQDSDGGAYRFPFPPFQTVALGGALNSQKQRQVSEELQILGNYDRFDYIFGGYYFWEKGDSNVTRFFRPLPVGADGVIQYIPAQDLVSGQRERASNTSYALYAHAGWHPIDSIDIAGGLRYTKDERLSFDDRFPPSVRSTAEFRRINYDVSATYNVNADIHFYGRYATGYQSGGVIRRALFKPEDSRSAEVGLKSELFDRRVRLNLALFDQHIDDQQAAGFDPVAGIFVQNIGKVKIRGVEAELTVRPLRGLTIGNNIGYNDPKTSTGDRQRAPKFTYSFFGEYDLPKFDNGAYPSIRVDGDYRSRYFAIGATLPSAERANPAFPLPPFVYAGYANEQAYLDDLFKDYRLGGYWLANARIGVNDIALGGAKFRVTGFVRNLFNSGGAFYGVSLGGLVATFERPRTYGVEIGATF